MLNKQINPIIRMDFPDPDVIRVDDTYYLISTTMYFMPGAQILRSYDLINWEHVAYVYNRLDSTKKQTLSGNENAYGKGMWAASLRYNQGTFYVCFVANDTGKTYLFTSTQIEGPWQKNNIEGFYHDCSLFFENERVFIVYGNKDIHLTELSRDLSAPLKGGINKILVSDSGNNILGYEGSHLYKIKGKYYLFLIHSLATHWRRTEACFVANSIDGEYKGGDCLNDDRGYCNQGVAQGGIVDTPDGTWFAILFQDYGAVGRIPVLIPVSFKDNYPVFGDGGKIPFDFPIKSTRPDYKYQSLFQSDDFTDKTASPTEKNDCFGFKSVWQFNHEPDLSLITLNKEQGFYTVKTAKVCTSLLQAKNTLTQRMIYPNCSAEIEVDGSNLNDGDYTGICAFQGYYGFVAITRRNNKYFIVMVERNDYDTNKLNSDKEKQSDNDGHLKFETERECIEVETPRVCLRLDADFTNMNDTSSYYYKKGDSWVKLGSEHKLYFKLDLFTGCRFGLFMYSTKTSGGTAKFTNFKKQSK